MATPRKKWSELSERTKKAKLAKGIKPAEHDAAIARAAKGGWKALSPATQKRYSGGRNAITPEQYNAGVSLKAARGHQSWRDRAIQFGILDSINGDAYKALPDDIADDLGKKWIDGFMSKSRGPLEPIKMSDWRYTQKEWMGKKVRYQTAEQAEARIQFLNFLDENPDLEQMSKDDWKKYRDNYMNSFTKQ